MCASPLMLLPSMPEAAQQLEGLCGEIAMPGELTAQILPLAEAVSRIPRLEELYDPQTWDAGYERLSELLGEDPRGVKTLCYFLFRAEETWDQYRALGWSRERYRDTMRCFSRFAGEYRRRWGRDGFDRGRWTVRQISGRLVRVGELEYERTTLEGKPALSLHIPSDARLLPDLLRLSWAQAREDLGAAFPEYRDVPLFCDSWLLSPALKELLPETSNILRFQRSFSITPLDRCSFMRCVFSDPELPLAQQPEDTTLRRRVKAFLLSGGTIPDGRGILSSDPFREL